MRHWAGSRYADVHVKMPEVRGVQLTGEMPAWVSAKDVLLEMLRSYGVRGGFGRTIEYYEPGLKHLSAIDRHVIAEYDSGRLLWNGKTRPPPVRILRQFNLLIAGDQKVCLRDH